MASESFDLSVIIPTYNRKDVVISALQALCRQDLAADRFEIVVADDGSRDGTGDAVQAFAAQAPVRIVYSWEANRGANAARNRAIGMARGRLLVIINDDTIAVPEFLSLHLSAHQVHPLVTDAVLGRMTISPEVPPSFFARLHLDDWYSQIDNRRELDWKSFATCNISVKAAFLAQHGLFDERMRWHEDVELGERLMHHGLRVIYEPAALGLHLHHLREKDYLGVAAREGVSLAEWYAKNPSVGPRMAEIGFHVYASPRKRLVYRVADAVFAGPLNRWLVALARRLTAHHPGPAETLYRKLYQAEKRRATRHRMKELGIKHV